VRASVFSVRTDGTVGPSVQSIRTNLGEEKLAALSSELSQLPGFAGLDDRRQHNMWVWYPVDSAFQQADSLAAFAPYRGP
jgi:hypothetical protein